MNHSLSEDYGARCFEFGRYDFENGRISGLMDKTDECVPDPYYLDKKVKLVELFSYHKLGLTNKYTHLFGDS